MAELEFEIQIAAPPQLVAAFFVPQRLPYWYGAEMDACFEMLGGAPDFAAGQKVRITGRLGGREVELTVVVVRYEWANWLEWRFQDAYGVRGMQSWEIAATAHGSLVRMRDVYEMPGMLGRVADRLFTRLAVARRDRAWLARLRRAVERR
jgi:polyketide cyclase/dehydrase/lipid transport protein